MGNELLRYAPLLLTIAGWWLVNQQNNKREARKECRALIDAAKREIVRIADDATRYFMDTTSQLDRQITWSLDALEIEIERLPPESTAVPITAFSKFADACTSGQFQEKNRRQLDHTSDQIKAIHLARNHLISSLERHFDLLYHKKVSLFRRCKCRADRRKAKPKPDTTQAQPPSK